ncbi:MAG: peptidoglycan DD-metalloendopeptidase family protein [Pseudomonadota bacterium]|nr:peptidoglycan DD-metalloendopeptidase family protein [Pseudomonadota bacterium]
MSELLNALLVAAGLSAVAGGLAWGLARFMRRGLPDTDLPLWRAARLAALLPLPLALVIYAVPQRIPAMEGALSFEPVSGTAHGPLPLAAAQAPAGWATALPSLPSLLLALYLTGLAVSLALAFARHLARRRMMAASRMAGRDERRALETLAERIGVRAPELRIGPDTASPVLTGWRGVVLVPDALFSRPDALRFALAHELTHLRRGDERDRLVGAALISLFWFNVPLLWIETELNAAREMACDRDTLEALGGARRKAYASALIETLRIAAPAASAFGPHDRRHREMRIKAIMSSSAARKGRAGLLAATVLAAALPVAGAQALMTERRIVSEQVPSVSETRTMTPEAGEATLSAQDAQNNDDWQASIDRLTPVIERAESSAYDRAIALQLRGRAYYELDRIEDAIADWRAAIATGAMTAEETDNLRTNIGQLLIATERYEAGLAELESVLAGEEPDQRMMRILAQAYAQAGRFDDGLGYARTVYETRPAENNFNLLLYYYQELGMQAELTALEENYEPPAAPDAPKAIRRPAPVAPAAEPAAQAEPRPVTAPAPALTHRVAHGRVTSRYGNRPARPAGAPVFHHGTDIAAERGTPIVAPGAGVVVHAAAGFNGEAAWGNTVAIDHGNGWQTVYAHMEGFDVSPGDRVTPGQQIGRVGSTGRSTGPHVHVELRHNGERVDPAGYLPGL